MKKVVIVLMVASLFACKKAKKSATNMSGTVLIQQSDSLNTSVTSEEASARFVNNSIPDSIAIVSGRITGDKDNYLRVLEKMPFEKEQSQRIDFLGESGDFSGEVIVRTPGFYTLKHRGHRIKMFLRPQDSIYVDLHTGLQSGVRFGGTAGAMNQFHLYLEKLNKGLSLRDASYKMEHADFVNLLAEQRAIKEENLAMLSSNFENLPESFLKLEKAQIIYDWGNYHLKYFEKNAAAKSDLNASALFLDAKFLKEFDFKDPSLFRMKSYRDFVENYFNIYSNRMIQKRMASGEFKDYMVAKRLSAKYAYVDEVFKSKPVRGFLKTKIVEEMIKDDGTAEMNPLILKYRKEVENESYQAQIEKSYFQFVEADDASFAPDFKSVDMYGKPTNLWDYKGKYIYVDVWATWCAPCKIEEPFFDQLKLDYAKEDRLVFMSVSIDKDKSAWERSVRSKHNPGIQLHVSGDAARDFADKYRLQGMPQFILIDPDGLIVDLSAPRPSKNIRAVFSGLGLGGSNLSMNISQ